MKKIFLILVIVLGFALQAWGTVLDIDKTGSTPTYLDGYIQDADDNYCYGFDTDNGNRLVKFDSDWTKTIGLTSNTGGWIERVKVTALANNLLVVAGDDSGQTSAKWSVWLSEDGGQTFFDGSGSAVNINNKNSVLDLGHNGATHVAGTSVLRGMCQAYYGGSHHFLIGEYNNNTSRTPGGTNDEVTIWESTDLKTWNKLVTWNTDGTHYLKHIHTIVQDPDTEAIYIGFGDVVSTDIVGILKWEPAIGVWQDNKNAAWLTSELGFTILDGSVAYKPIDILITENYIHWFTDDETKGIYRADKDLSNVVEVNNDLQNNNFKKHVGWYGTKLSSGTLVFTDQSPAVSAWTASTVISYTLLNRPTTSNGMMYQAMNVGSAPHQTGADEPTWPTTIGQTVVDGDITWTAYKYSLPISVWVSDNEGATYDLSGTFGTRAGGSGYVDMVEFNNKLIMSSQKGSGRNNYNAVILQEYHKDFDSDFPIIFNPIYWVDGTNGVDNITTNFAANPDGDTVSNSGPVKSLQYILKSNLITNGARVIIKSGEYEIGSYGIVADWDSNAYPGIGYTTIEGQTDNPEDTKIYNPAASVSEYTVILKENYSNTVFKNFWLYNRKVSSPTHVLSTGSGTVGFEFYCRNMIVGHKSYDSGAKPVIQHYDGLFNAKRTIFYGATTPGLDIIRTFATNSDISFLFCLFDGGSDVLEVNGHAGVSVDFTGCILINYFINGIHLLFGTTEIPVIKNCIFSSGTNTPINDGAGVTETDDKIDYNLYLTDLINIANAGGSHSIFVDPSMQLSGELNADSPCINAGTLDVSNISLGPDLFGKYIYKMFNIGADQGAGAPKRSRMLRIGGFGIN